jgi:hypothetical protein
MRGRTAGIVYFVILWGLFALFVVLARWVFFDTNTEGFVMSGITLLTPTLFLILRRRAAAFSLIVLSLVTGAGFVGQYLIETSHGLSHSSILIDLLPLLLFAAVPGIVGLATLRVKAHGGSLPPGSPLTAEDQRR